MDKLVAATYGLSMLGMAEAIYLRGSRPDVSIPLMWFSVVVSTTAMVDSALKDIERPVRRRTKYKESIDA